MTHNLLVALCACLLPAMGGAATKRPSTSQSEFTSAWSGVVQRFEQRARAEKVVGGAIAFTNRDHGRHWAFFGMQDLQTRAAVNEETIFHWASITKTFTAIAAMQAVERNQLDLDAPAMRYLPELRQIHNPFGPVEDVKVIHLMTHTAGLRSPTWPWGGDKPWHPHEPRQWSQLVAMMPYTGLEFRPGEKYSYSNPGYTFLGRMIETVSGEDIEAYIDKNVLRPLHMYSAYFDLTPPYLSAHRSNNYYLIDGAPVPNGPEFDTGVTNSNGGLNASIEDMVRYLEFLSDCESNKQPLPLACDALESMWNRLQWSHAKRASWNPWVADSS